MRNVEPGRDVHAESMPAAGGVLRREPVEGRVDLAERVAVMSARPGRIKTIVDTKFDKNDPDIFKNKAFVEKVDELWNLVRIEAIKAQERAAP